MPSSTDLFNFTGRHFFRFADTLPLGDLGGSDFIVVVDVSCFSTELLLVDNCCNGGTELFSKLVRVDS